MKWFQQYGDTLLAVITAVLSVGHMEHWFSAEWIVLVSAVATAAVAFFTSREQPQALPTPKPQK